jgi:hypothetical protein
MKCHVEMIVPLKQGLKQYSKFTPRAFFDESVLGG